MIRLIHIETLLLEEFDDDNIPPYAIASHRWLNNEVTFQNYKAASSKKARKAFAKIEGFCKFLRTKKQMLQALFGVELNHIWIDTCCINKESMPELSEAINLMFRWYNHSHICIAYLFDVDGDGVERSSWFTRGWTLQELLAPGMVLFVDSQWKMQGYKHDKAMQLSKSGSAKLSGVIGPVLHRRLSQRTRVPEQVLTDIQEIENVSFSMVLDWMEGRYTARLEDQAYCLLGILDVRMPLNYGERDEAMIRLLHGIRTKCELRVSRPKAYDLSEESVSSLKQQLELLDETIVRLDKDKTRRRFKSRPSAHQPSRKRARSPDVLVSGDPVGRPRHGLPFEQDQAQEDEHSPPRRRGRERTPPRRPLSLSLELICTEDWVQEDMPLEYGRLSGSKLQAQDSMYERGASSQQLYDSSDMLPGGGRIEHPATQALDGELPTKVMSPDHHESPGPRRRTPSPTEHSPEFQRDLLDQSRNRGQPGNDMRGSYRASSNEYPVKRQKPVRISQRDPPSPTPRAESDDLWSHGVPPWLHQAAGSLTAQECFSSDNNNSCTVTDDAANIFHGGYAIPDSLLQVYPDLAEMRAQQQASTAMSMLARPQAAARSRSRSTPLHADSLADHPFWNPLKSARRLEGDT